MLFGPPDKSQLSDASYSAYQKQPTGGCQEKEVALMRRTTVVLGLVLALLVAFGVVGVATAADTTDTSALRNAVSVEGIMKHENAFQKIANSNGGTRVSGSPGYDASAAYVKRQLKAAGYTVTKQKFTYPFFQELTPTTFSRTAPPPGRAYVRDRDFNIMGYSGSGNLVDAQVVPTNDIQIPPGATDNSSHSGCEASDFVDVTSVTEDRVALIQRGGSSAGGTVGCNFRTKALNAQAAGYDAAIVFNEGQPTRTGLIGGGLSGLGVNIPVLMTTFAVGEELYNLDKASPGSVRVSISADTIAEQRTTSNVIADYPDGRTDRTLIVGAHLDSVPEGPGINDNGSGAAGILEIALQMKKLGIQPTNHVRFAFWGAEESGPPQWGSQHYVDQLGEPDQPRLEDIALYLNFDMIGSPNYVRFVYDGASQGPDPGSVQIETVFNDYFGSQGLDTEPTPLDGRSDYQAFLNAGIPAGGATSGSDGIKTPEQATLYGGTAGKPYDPCYHKACDTIDNLNPKSIDELADGAAHATLTFAQTTSAVNGTN
jgi:Zn-dependent M28 family amino/carboxypeptidase